MNLHKVKGDQSPLQHISNLQFPFFKQNNFLNNPKIEIIKQKYSQVFDQLLL